MPCTDNLVELDARLWHRATYHVLDARPTEQEIELNEDRIIMILDESLLEYIVVMP